MIKQLLGLDDINDVKRYELSEADWRAIDEMVTNKYKNWEWNYGRSPRYEYNRDAKLAAGTIDITLAVEHGRIKACRIYGDFLVKAILEKLKSNLSVFELLKQICLML